HRKGHESYSAGDENQSRQPQAIKDIGTINLYISSQNSNFIDQDILKRSNLVVTLCSDTDENCPVIPQGVKKEHWPFDDPAGREWSEFQRVRDEIEEKIKDFKRTF